MQNNIIFGAPWDEERYKKVLYQCALERDLQLFDAGDNTEVGEKGRFLQFGQQWSTLTVLNRSYSVRWTEGSYHFGPRNLLVY